MTASLASAGFTYTALPARVLFGFGTLARVGDEVRRLGCRRALVLSTPQQAREAGRLVETLGDLAAGSFCEAAMHTPTDVTERALYRLRELGADSLIALGGGSTTGLGKALALRTDLPQVVIPTTYAGSEATPILGETRDGRKTTRRGPEILPEVIVYDVDLTFGLPVPSSVTSGINALAHAVEALYAEEANPVIAMMAEAGIAALGWALPAIVADPADRGARGGALYGAWLCGTCLGSVGMALHHKLCHVLGGTFDLPHAETHTVLLPHVVAYNAAVAAEPMARAARALGVADAAQGLFDLVKRLGAPTSLRAIGMAEGDLDRAAEAAVASPYWNPRRIEREAIRDLLQAAYDGSRPGSASWPGASEGYGEETADAGR